MQTKFIEATNIEHGGGNWGKFMLGRFTEQEWQHRSRVAEDRSLVRSRGWTTDHIFVLDLQTGEGALFRHGGYARADLDKTRIWVCPLFEPFLTWLYRQDVSDLDALPDRVALDDPGDWRGYRRPGPPEEQAA